MAVVVKNTFLDIADHTFLGLEESIVSRRRCHSTPRVWKPSPSTPAKRSRRRSLSTLSSCSTESNFSDSQCSSFMCSLCDSDETCRSCEDVPAFICATPTSPHKFADCLAPCCYLLDCTCGIDDSIKAPDDSVSTATNGSINDSSDTDLESARADSRLDAVVMAAYYALLSSGQTHKIKIDQGAQGSSSTLIVAELQNAHRSRCYDVVHAARRALEDVTSHSKSVALLSKRVQKDDRGGYSLRSSVACIPEDMVDNVCWDMFQKGHCPRRMTCKWYHPQESDIFKVKIVVRCTEGTISSEDQLSTSSPAVRHTISLGDLI